MDFQKCKILMTIDEERSISKASSKLYLSQPTLSQILQKIEQQLGYELFSRNRAGLTPTYAGDKYVAMCRSILELKKRVDDEVAGYYHKKRNRISFCLSVTWSRLLLPKVLPEFRKLYPDVEVNIRLSTSEYIPDILLRNEADLALMVLPLNRRFSKDLEYDVILNDEILVTLHKDNPLVGLATEKPGTEFPYLSPELLANEKFILSPPEGRLRQSSDNFFFAHGIVPNIIVVDISLETTAVLVALGIGTTFLNTCFAKDFMSRADTISQELRFFSTAPSLLPWKIAFLFKKNFFKRIYADFISLTKKKLQKISINNPMSTT